MAKQTLDGFALKQWVKCGRGVFFQGDDADTFRDELTAAYTGHPDWPVERTLRFLWGELDYGLASQPWDDGRDPTL